MSFSPYLICSVGEQRKNLHTCNFFLNFALRNGSDNLVVTEDKYLNRNSSLIFINVTIYM